MTAPMTSRPMVKYKRQTKQVERQAKAKKSLNINCQVSAVKQNVFVRRFQF